MQGAKKEKYFNSELVSKIEEIEKEMLQEKNWTMKGEVMAQARPKDSLLQEHLEFNRS